MVIRRRSPPRRRCASVHRRRSWVQGLLGIWLAIPSLALAAESGPAPAVSVEVLANINYAASDHPRQTLDLYLPAARPAGRLLPVVVFVHGGGWQNGSKAGAKSWLEPYVSSGDYAGVAIGYRLAGDARWPAQIHDCKAAIRWLRAHAARHGLDPARIGVAGSSAGGTLATLLGTSGDVADLEGDVGPHVRESSRVRCVLNLFGRINFLAEPESARAAPAQADALRNRLQLLFGGTLEEKAALARRASPIHHLTPDDPPILTLHGTIDPVVPFVQALELDAATKRAGVPHLLLPLEGLGHGFRHAEADRRTRQFFDLHLRDSGKAVDAAAIVAPAKR